MDPGDRFCGECGASVAGGATPGAASPAPARRVSERRLGHISQAADPLREARSIFTSLRAVPWIDRGERLAEADGPPTHTGPAAGGAGVERPAPDAPRQEVAIAAPDRGQPENARPGQWRPAG